MAHGTSLIDQLRSFSVRTEVEVVTCPRCGAVWAKRKRPDLLGQACPLCHGYKPVFRQVR